MSASCPDTLVGYRLLHVKRAAKTIAPGADGRQSQSDDTGPSRINNSDANVFAVANVYYVVESVRRGAALVVVTCGVFSGVAFTEQAYRSAAPVCVRITANESMSGSAFRTMREEASRIWQRHGIDLSWTQPVPDTCPTVVPLIFDDHALVKLAGGKIDQALARTLFAGRATRIYVSVPRAFAMLSHLISGASLPIDTVGERDYRGGMLIGRVVAHELGHVLLSSLAHSKAGLMRPVFGVRDVLSNDEKTTDLLPTEAERLAARFSLEPLDGRPTPSVVARGDVGR